MLIVKWVSNCLVLTNKSLLIYKTYLTIINNGTLTHHRLLSIEYNLYKDETFVLEIIPAFKSANTVNLDSI